MNADTVKIWTTGAASRFVLRLAAWLSVYVALLVPWGTYNHWPTSQIISTAYLPLCLLAAAGLSRRHHFAWEPPDPPSHWELLISFQLLAIGVATGYMLLISVAWVCVGVAWLRPIRPDVNWVEWYKLPILFLLCFPVLSDLAGSRHDWLFAKSAGTLAGGEHAWPALFQETVGIRIAVLSLAWFLDGLAFWLGLATLPVFYLLVRTACLTTTQPVPPGATWLTSLAALALALAVGRSWGKRGVSSHPLLAAMASELRHRSHALWLATLVTLMQQQSLTEAWLAGGKLNLDVTGATLLLLCLVVLRVASAPVGVDFRSRAVLVASQLVLFAAEFTDLNPLRHVALGLFLVAALSWGRSWSWLVLLGSGLCWLTVIPSCEAILELAGLTSATAAYLRLGAFITSLVLVVGAAGHAAAQSTPRSQIEHDWQPEQRYVFILLGLLLLFQTISAFWSEDQLGQKPLPDPSPNAQAGLVLHRLDTGAPGTLEAHYEINLGKKTWQLWVRQEGPIPVATTSAETILRREKWEPDERRLVSHEFGQVAALDLHRLGQTAHAVHWFQHGQRTFVNHLRARRILWSSWMLNRRDLHSFLLLGETPASTEDLLEFARRQGWFPPAR